MPNLWNIKCLFFNPRWVINLPVHLHGRPLVHREHCYSQGTLSFLLFSPRVIAATSLLHLKPFYNALFFKNRKKKHPKVVFSWLAMCRRWSLLTWGLSFIPNSPKHIRNSTQGVCLSRHCSVFSRPPPMVPVRRVTIHTKSEARCYFAFPRSHGKNVNLGSPGRGEQACALLPLPSPYEFQHSQLSKGLDVVVMPFLNMKDGEEHRCLILVEKKKPACTVGGNVNW